MARSMRLAGSARPRIPSPPLSAFGGTDNSSDELRSGVDAVSQASGPRSDSDQSAGGGIGPREMRRGRFWTAGRSSSGERPMSAQSPRARSVEVFAIPAAQDNYYDTRVLSPARVARLERMRMDRARRHGLRLSETGDSSSRGNPYDSNGPVSGHGRHTGDSDTSWARGRESDDASIPRRTSGWTAGRLGSDGGQSEDLDLGGDPTPLADPRRPVIYHEPTQFNSDAGRSDEPVDDTARRPPLPSVYQQSWLRQHRRRPPSESSSAYSLYDPLEVYPAYRTASAPPESSSRLFIPRSAPGSGSNSRPPSGLRAVTPSQTNSPSRARSPASGEHDGR